MTVSMRRLERRRIKLGLVLGVCSSVQAVDMYDPDWSDDGMFHPPDHDPRGFLARRGLSNETRLLEENECISESESGLCCQRCDYDLPYCGDILSGFLVEDTYYFDARQDDGVCFDIARRAGNLNVFGKSKSFRDTPECRQLVQDYTCLWWSSSSSAYKNNCDSEGDTLVPPCRSFCSQLAIQCANSLDYMELCTQIACPPLDDTCTPGPVEVGQYGCDIVRYFTPEDAAVLTVKLSALALLSSFLLSIGLLFSSCS